jgi:S-adenosylmethionine:tRNA ribosyltransferase-isomerase
MAGMRISDFNYELPEVLIAQHPPAQRGTTRLLVLERANGQLTDKAYPDILDYLNSGDIVVLNDTKVVKARLIVSNSVGQERELLLLETHGHESNPHQRKALHRGKLHVDERLKIHDKVIRVTAVYDDGTVDIESDYNILDLAEHEGTVPLPPYMKRDANAQDTERYQTVFAHNPGSVAAPTASLNFTDELAEKLRTKGVQIVYLTLHVGLGTFLPIRTDNIEDHVMHSEYFEIPTNTVQVIQRAKVEGRKILAVGTTVARTLEYAADQIFESPPDHQDISFPGLTRESRNITGEADIFIYPGYEFKIVNMLLTNFHAPKSTVLMLAATFAGWENLEQAYRHAIEQEYNFLSYGDSMLIV